MNQPSSGTSDATPLLTLRDISKQYTSGSSEIAVLRDIQLTLHRGERCALVGPSGSGKSTLLSIAAGLLNPTSGQVRILGACLNDATEDQRAILRRTVMGFVFQNFNLVPTLSALENVMLPLELSGHGTLRKHEREAREALALVGMQDRPEHYPWQLSGGEQQRVALARAFVHKPALIFADEPTGSLDGATGEQITQLLLSLNRERGTALLLVTHNPLLAAVCDRTVTLAQGRVV